MLKMSSDFKKYLKESLYENHPSMRSNNTSRSRNNSSGCKPCQAAKVERLAEEFGYILSENSSDIIGSVMTEGFDIASLVTMFKPLLEKLMKKFGVGTSDIFDMAESYLGGGALQNLMEMEIPLEQDDDDDWVWIIIIVIIAGVVYYLMRKKKRRGHKRQGVGDGTGDGGTHPGDAENVEDIENIPNFPQQLTDLGNDGGGYG